jgi:uncharacterized protein (TIGR02246 family)
MPSSFRLRTGAIAKLAAAGSAALLLAAAPALAATPDAELASARPVIDAVNADWIPAMQAHDGGRIAAAYAEDGLFVLPDGKVVAGRAQVAALMQKRFTPGFRVVSGGLTQDGLGYAQGGLIIEWGHGGLTYADASGRTHTSSGPYLTVWKRDGAGDWKIIRNLAF